MREIDLNLLRDKVKDAFIHSNYVLNEDIRDALKAAYQKEDNPKARSVLEVLIKNYEIAEQGVYPLCQDTGVSVIFCEIGQDIQFINGSLQNVLNEAVAEAYEEGYLRKSMVNDVLNHRKNTQDNTPAIIHYELVAGDRLRLIIMPKGGGSENMSTLIMMKPADGEEGIIQAVIDHIKKIKGSPCPPLIVGIGIGGNFETCALLAKKSLLRELTSINPDPHLQDLEERLLEMINETGIGPMGLGGRTTALKVNILSLPCHIASLPVAINVECHAHRYKIIDL